MYHSFMGLSCLAGFIRLKMKNNKFETFLSWVICHSEPHVCFYLHEEMFWLRDDALKGEGWFETSAPHYQTSRNDVDSNQASF